MDDEGKLIEEARAGSERAFAELLRRHQVPVRAYPDGTRLELDEATVVREFTGRDVPAGKRVRVEQGIVTARVARQGARSPMVFATPHGEARVLGTALRLVVEPGERGSTRLEVTEGKVRLTRLKDRKSVEVASGQYAVAAAGMELLARPLVVNLVANPGFEMGRAGSPERRAPRSLALGRRCPISSGSARCGGIGLECAPPAILLRLRSHRRRTT